MSLIDEALKRARMEAAQRAAEQEGLPYPAIPRHLAPRRRRAWLAPTIVAMAVAVGLLAGWWIASRGPRAEQSAAAGQASSAAAPATSGAAVPAEVPLDAPPVAPQSAAPDTPPGLEGGGTQPAVGEPAETEPNTSGPAGSAEPAGAPVPAAPPAPARSRQGVCDTVRQPPAQPSPVSPERQPTAPPAATPAERTPASGAEPATAVIAPGQAPGETPLAEPRSADAPAVRPTPEPPPPVAEPAESPAATTAVTDPESGVLLVLPDRQRESGGAAPTETATESHVQRFALPQGGTIELGGIAWSETGPFALLNGRVVGPGAVILGYTLESIRPGHVELSGEGRRIRLSLQ